MIDRETWIILADRLDAIRWACEVLAAEAEPVPELVFDSNDQATLKQ